MQEFSRREFAARALKLSALALATWAIPSGCGSGARVVNVPVPFVSPLASADQLAMQNIAMNFMDANIIPGLSIAIAKNGKLMYVGAFGVANLETGEPLSPSHLFRIASISKPITATAIFLLIESGQLNLTSLVFGPSGILGDRFAPYGQYVTGITVADLLVHTSGGWANVPHSSDPAFLNPSLDIDQLLAFVLQNVALTSPPATKYAYSNFGFMILGRVIEKVTGLPYATAVQLLVLGPCGISDMRIGGDTLADRLPNEVVYYGKYPDNVSPYTLPVSRMDSAAGWLATPSDLVAFLMRVDGNSNVPDILSPSALTMMTTPPTPMLVSDRASYGWSSDLPSVPQWWHYGLLDGTGAMAERTYDGYCWAVLANSTSDAWSDQDLVTLVRNMASAVKSWPY